jgi:hypothetical protein
MKQTIFVFKTNEDVILNLWYHNYIVDTKNNKVLIVADSLANAIKEINSMLSVLGLMIRNYTRNNNLIECY